jgi:ribosomal protein S18 acetylase RimI-like enzyme
MPVATMVIVRPMTEADIEGVIALQKRAFPKMPPWTRRQLRLHLQHFPDGQLVAVDRTGRVVGSASSLIIDWDPSQTLASWSRITGNGTFKTHDPVRGRTLYGADIGVHPDSRGMGVGAALYAARRQLAERYNLQRIVAGGRIPGYAAVKDEMDAETYVREVAKGRLKDAVLGFQLAQGFQVRGVIPGYLPCDKASCGYATLIEWINPAYHGALGQKAA